MPSCEHLPTWGLNCQPEKQQKSTFLEKLQLPHRSNEEHLKLVRPHPGPMASQPGQLPASGGAAPSGASLDVDDFTGETDQDWSEGRAPFPEDYLPDGGGGGAARA